MRTLAGFLHDCHRGIPISGYSVTATYSVPDTPLGAEGKVPNAAGIPNTLIGNSLPRNKQKSISFKLGAERITILQKKEHSNLQGSIKFIWVTFWYMHNVLTNTLKCITIFLCQILSAKIIIRRRDHLKKGVQHCKRRSVLD